MLVARSTLVMQPEMESCLGDYNERHLRKNLSDLAYTKMWKIESNSL